MATNNNNVKFSLKTILVAVGLVVGAATTVAGVMGGVFSTKAEVAAKVAAVKEEVKDDMAKHKIKATQVEWDVKHMATRVKNIERRQIQMAENITKLLERLRVRPADPPYLAPLPRRPPDPDGEIPE